MSGGFDPTILSKLDLSKWTPVAVRQRAWLPEAGPRRWTTVEGSPLSEATAKSGRMAGYLLTALRCDQDTETLLVRLTEQGREALVRQAKRRHSAAAP
jgi:hypothetical protein